LPRSPFYGLQLLNIVRVDFCIFQNGLIVKTVLEFFKFSKFFKTLSDSIFYFIIFHYRKLKIPFFLPFLRHFHFYAFYHSYKC